MGSKLVVYADDMLLYRKIDCLKDYTMLQISGSETSLSPSSFKNANTCLFSCKRQGYFGPPDLLLDDLTLEKVEYFKIQEEEEEEKEN